MSKSQRKPRDNWTRADYLAVPELPQRRDEPIRFSLLVLLPTRRKHDSGFNVIDCVLIDKHGTALGRISACIDVIHIDGIGGRGRDPHTRFSGWSIDLLSCGLFRLFTYGELFLEPGYTTSSFEIFSRAPSDGSTDGRMPARPANAS